jgi:four helix bundle protein
MLWSPGASRRDFEVGRWSRRSLLLGREDAGLHANLKSPSVSVRTAIVPSRFDWRPAFLDHSATRTAPPQSRWRSFVNLTTENANDAPTASVAPDANAPPLLDHERLDVFQVALELAAMIPALTKAARPALRDQLERASSSIALTLAEGNARRTRRDRHHFFSMAQGSAMECAAAIDVLRVTGHLAPADATRAKHKLTRIVQMLVGLRRSR